jgi:hypothetical protein
MNYQAIGQVLGALLQVGAVGIVSGQIPLPPQYGWVTSLAGLVLQLFTNSNAVAVGSPGGPAHPAPIASTPPAPH